MQQRAIYVDRNAEHNDRLASKVFICSIFTKIVILIESKFDNRSIKIIRIRGHQ